MSNRLKLRTRAADRPPLPASAGRAMIDPDSLPKSIPASVRQAVSGHGEEWLPGHRIARGTAVRFCFVNAAQLALKSRDLTYAEGIARTAGQWVHHAWCVNDQGRAVESTWGWLGDRYIGILIDDRAVKDALRKARPHFRGLLV